MRINGEGRECRRPDGKNPDYFDVSTKSKRLDLVLACFENHCKELVALYRYIRNSCDDIFDIRFIHVWLPLIDLTPLTAHYSSPHVSSLSALSR